MLDLVIGGVRSGKTRVAQDLAASAGRPVVYVATSVPGDAEYRARIEAHRRSRPADWQVVEEPQHVAEVIASLPGKTIIVDCLGMFVTNLLFAGAPLDDELEPGAMEAECEPRSSSGSVPSGVDISPEAVRRVLARVEQLAATAAAHDDRQVIVVSNEVGQGVVPDYPLGRVFRDVLGEANQILARRAGRVFLTVAGIAIDIKALSLQAGPGLR